MSKVSITSSKLDALANAISLKSGETVPLTLDEMVQAVDGIETGGGGGITPTGNINISQAGVTDVTNYATATVPQGEMYATSNSEYYTENNQRKWRFRGEARIDTNDGDGTPGFIANETYVNGTWQSYNAVPKNTAITPTTSSQTIGGANYMMEGAVTVAAMPSGTAGTPTATKGAVSNHSVSVTPSVTNTTGYITGSTKTGTAVSVSASELVSGNLPITQNGNNIDVTNYATVSVDVSGSSGMTVATATATPASASSSISFTVSGEPTSFVITSDSDLATGASPYKVASVVFDGTNVIGQTITNTSNAQVTYNSTGFTKSYSNGTLTVSSTVGNFQANQYTLVYSYGGSSANLGTDDVQVGSGATSITFTNLSDEPDYFSLIFKDNFATSSGYQRVITVVYDGSSTYGLAMDSGAKAASSWSYTYSNGSLTISSTSTSAGGYFHQPGYYQLTYGYGGEAAPIEVESLSVTENGTYTAPRGKAYSPVVVSVSGGGSATVATKTTTLSAIGQTLTFTQLSGTPKMWAVRCTTQVSSSGSTTYYYLMDAVYNGTSVKGNCFRIGSTRRIQNVTTGLSQSYSGGTLTITGGSSSGATPGQWYNGEYELVYVY